MHYEDDIHNWYNNTAAGRILRNLIGEYLSNRLKNVRSGPVVQIGDICHSAWSSALASSEAPILVCEQTPGTGRVICSECDRLPLQDDSINLLFLPHILENSYVPCNTLAESYRILAPEGMLVAISVNPLGVVQLLDKFFYHKLFPHGFAAQYINKQRNLLRTAGFVNIDFHFIGFNWGAWQVDRRVRFLLEYMGSAFCPYLSTLYVSIAQKQCHAGVAEKFSWSITHQGSNAQCYS